MTRTDDLQAILDRDPVNDRLHRELTELVTRWRIEDDPPNAGRGLQRQLEQDYPGTLRRFFRLSEADQRLVIGAYIAYHGTKHWTVEGLLGEWRKSLARIKADSTAGWLPPRSAADAQQCAVGDEQETSGHG